MKQEAPRPHRSPEQPLASVAIFFHCITLLQKNTSCLILLLLSTLREMLTLGPSLIKILCAKFD